MRLREARADDVVAAFGKLLPMRVRAWAGEADGRVLGVGGLARFRNGVWVAFVRIEPEGRRYPVSLHKAGLMTMREARAMGLRRVLAAADLAASPAAENWLLRLGFERREDGVFVWQIR